MALTREEQLEQALDLARERIAEIQRRHEASELAWFTKCQALQARLEQLQASAVSDVVKRSKAGIH